jgi:hypothetical protein
MIVFYKNTIYHLLQYGDHFLFEDSIGRFKRLPCVQFQDWKVRTSIMNIATCAKKDGQIFHEFLINSFQDSPGLSLVLRERFMVMNGYNNQPISRKSWRAVIQPKCKITMAMVLDDTRAKQGKCVDPLCSGQVKFSTANRNVIW